MMMTTITVKTNSGLGHPGPLPPRALLGAVTLALRPATAVAKAEPTPLGVARVTLLNQSVGLVVPYRRAPPRVSFTIYSLHAVGISSTPQKLLGEKRWVRQQLNETYSTSASRNGRPA